MNEELRKEIAALVQTGEERNQKAEMIENQWKNTFMGVADQQSCFVREPHLVNLNEDERLSETLVYPFAEGTHWIGRRNSGNPPTVEFNGMGIIKDHCQLEYVGDEVFLIPYGNSRTHVNGKKIKKRTQIVHRDRVWLGDNYAFRFVFPGHESAGGGTAGDDPNYEMAAEELMAATSMHVTTDNGRGGLSRLDHKITEALKRMQQAVTIVNDLERTDISFEAKVCKGRFADEPSVYVLVSFQDGSEYLWPWAKFNTRLVDMIKLWQEAQNCEAEGKPMPEIAAEADPFVDNEHQLVGEADIWLQSLANMIEITADISVLNPFGRIEGKLNIAIFPLDANGNPGPWEEDDPLDPFVDEPEELLNNKIRFQVRINSLQWDTTSAARIYTDVFVRYTFGVQDEWDTLPWISTKETNSHSTSIGFSFNKEHDLFMTEDALSHLLRGRITFQVWAKVSQSKNKLTLRPSTRGMLAVKKQELRCLEHALHQRKTVCDCPHCHSDVSWKEA
eukprot:TRINITY_DN65948_c8_g1_i1.p1 TRINITY_DN65948_c8_g1~~TRINITY_DN65948_c8_g1_i1.p1  ORF type:complete len:512 (-),score=70.87 TRINITY_DN65948_c8_g1_i1:1643-3154(-)